MTTFIDAQREHFGVESICKALQIAPSGYWRRAARRRNPALLPARVHSDAALAPQVEPVWSSNLQVYGYRKVWRQMHREGVAVARCTVERLMKAKSLQGVRRGKRIHTTVPDAKAPCPLDRVNRQFKADRPNQLWVSDFTYVWTRQGMVYVAFVIDVYARFVSIRYSERLAEAGIEPSVGSKGDSDDNALAETINGLYKTELIHRRAPWKSKEAVELATLEWVSWFNHHRLMAHLGYIPPAEAEANYHRQSPVRPSRPDSHQLASTKAGAIQPAHLAAGERRL